MKNSTLSTPREWKPLVRAAMIQVASLAHWSLIHTRSWCANSALARVRLAGKLEQAEAQVAQLREEVRIKDARMAGLPPHRRPFYAPSERLAILAPTVVPTSAGFWTAWFPFTLLQVWPFCWHARRSNGQTGAKAGGSL